jgi:hypothetical protein
VWGRKHNVIFSGAEGVRILIFGSEIIRIYFVRREHKFVFFGADSIRAYHQGREHKDFWGEGR